LYTSDTRETMERANFRKTRIIRYIIVAVVSIIVTLIYGYFGHGVRSNYMDFMFLIPLVLGTFITLINRKEDKLAADIFACSIITMVLGCFTKGVLDIAGATSNLIIIYIDASIILMAIGLIKLIFDIGK